MCNIFIGTATILKILRFFTSFGIGQGFENTQREGDIPEVSFAQGVSYSFYDPAKFSLSKKGRKQYGGAVCDFYSIC